MPSAPTIELNSDLWILAGFCFLISWFFARLYLNGISAAIVAGLKAAIPFLYFGVFFNPDWLLLDDVSYWQSGMNLVEAKFNPITIFGNEGMARLFFESGGFHILYPLWNFLAQYFFGTHYFAAVFLNVIVSVIAGYYLFKLLLELEFEKNYATFITVLFLFHPEVVVWSSFLNLKDVLVMALTISSLYYLCRIIRKFEWKTVVALGIIFGLWGTIRFYIPILLLMSVGAYWCLKLRLRNLVLIILAVIGAGVYAAKHSDIFSVIIPSEVAFGIFHFLFNPIPWQVETNYSFLTLPAWLHWIFFPLIVMGFVKFWRVSPRARFVLIYLVLAVLAFAVTPEVRGARHRLQLIPILAWLEFSMLWSFLPQKSAARLSGAGESA